MKKSMPKVLNRSSVPISSYIVDFDCVTVYSEGIGEKAIIKYLFYKVDLKILCWKWQFI